ncbi:MAG TPA: GMC family oxidoreductase [Solirubrobacteraceae bacterium]|jgi:choline dehydrogenase-like flavoprotein|nr:GMC family oxidoreductase [Solirubrobacteraceae bacterium]
MSLRHTLHTLARGSLRPPDNDSAFLLDVHRRAVPTERMARYDDSYEVDLAVVGAGAGGSVLAQRLARQGWKVVVLDAGPFWDPDADWVSDEAGSHHIYWTDPRVIGGTDPVELGKNNSGRGVGGSMIHYAGYAPRFHPSDFEVRTRDGVGEDWPISYWDLKAEYERVEVELPVAGEPWPWGDPHRYPHSPHPIAGGAEMAIAGARKLGIETRVGPVAIANGAFGNRPHCIYRGFCLQGCKVNAKASPLVTHIPDAIEHGVEFRGECMVAQVELDQSSGRVTGVRYFDSDGTERLQRAAAVAVCGYSIESPRLLLNSTSRRFPHGIGNSNDQVGRCVMVQGAPQVAGRFPMELRMYKAPPPEFSSEQFYETDETRGFARGFAIQTVGPLPIEWAQHVQAAGHWGHALREYMRDYNHWYTLGCLSELLPLPENRVTLSQDVSDRHGLPVARMDYSQCENDRKNIAFAKQTLRDILNAADAQDILEIDRYAHLVGGCRMGSDAERSVVNADHRVWDVPNLYVCDGSVMPTQGSANPALTIMALASRLARRLGAKQAGAGSGATAAARAGAGAGWSPTAN